MFWRFNMMTSRIDTLLEKEDVTLQEVMDEEDVLQECKAQNKKLIELLVKPENIEELVNMITQEPSDDLDEKLRYKYPNTACELLTCDVSQINDTLIGEDHLLNKIYTFMEAEGTLNPLLASFFSKVLGLLITRKSEQMLKFLKTKDDFVSHLLRHLGTSAIMDLLLRLITCIDSVEIRHQCISWLNEQCLIQRLVDMIHPTETDDKHCNASQSLCDIIRLSREQMFQMQEKRDDPLLTCIESKEVISKLLQNMLDGARVESVLISGLSVIQALLEYKRIGPEGSTEPVSSDNEQISQGLTNTIDALIPRLSDIHHLLLEPPLQFYCPMGTTVGQMDPPLGNTRLQVAKLVAILLANSLPVHSDIGNLTTVDILLDLFFKYSWNNFLHAQVECCINTILCSTYSTEGENKVESPLLEKLLSEYRIIKRVLDNWEDNDVQQSRPGGHRRGYMGHLTRMANRISDNMAKGNNSDKIKEAFLELPDDVRDKWDNFVSGTLAEVNKQNTVDLVGSHPLHSSSDDDTEFNIPFHHETAMQQMRLQLQQMTSNFIDQFGFNEEEFAEQEERVEAPFTDRISSIDFDIPDEPASNSASLFEQACKERMQQFDEQDSDEDIWEDKEITLSSPAQTHSTTQGRRDAAQVGSDESDESTDSDEELDSPAVIRQTPTTTSNTEKMDVDNAEWQTGFDDLPMDTSSGVAMDTTNSPWDGVGSSAGATSNADWADFNKEKSQSEETWADFSKFSSIDSSNLNKSETDPGPRSSSPDVMDTADSTSNATSSRQAAYLVSSAPADLATEVVSSSSSSPNSSERNNNSCAGDSGVSSSTANEGSEESVNHSSESKVTSTSRETDSSENIRQVSSAVPIPTHDNTPYYRGPPPFDISTTPPDDEPGDHNDEDADHLQQENDFDEDEDDDLSANFNFLARAGLMKGLGDDTKTSEVSSDNDVSAEEAAKLAEQKRIEEARAGAKEALEQFMAQTQNGPV